MNASLAIQKREEARKLPLGHVDIKKTEEVVKKIYQRSHAIQKYWNKRLDKFRFMEFTPKECIVFCNNLCRMIGARTLKRVIYRSPDVKPGTAAHYRANEIHFGYCAWLSVMIHELAHHIVYQIGRVKEDHGEEFCFMENWLFQLAYEKLTGKAPKPYWVEESLKILDLAS